MPEALAGLSRSVELSGLHVGGARREPRAGARDDRTGAESRTQKRGVPRQHGLGVVQAQSAEGSAGLHPEGSGSFGRTGCDDLRSPGRRLCRVEGNGGGARGLAQILVSRKERGRAKKTGCGQNRLTLEGKRCTRTKPFPCTWERQRLAGALLSPGNLNSPARRRRSQV